MNKSNKFQERPPINLSLRPNNSLGVLKTNLTKLRINNDLKIVYVYSIKFDTIIPLDNTFSKKIILRNLTQSLKEKFKPFIIAGDNLFSPIKIDEEINLTSKIIIAEEEKFFQVVINLIKDTKLELHQIITKDDEFYYQKKIFVEILIKNILHSNKLLRLRRLYLDKTKFEELNFNGFSGNLYMGYQTAAKVAELGLFLSVSIKFKIINRKSCLEQLNNINYKQLSGSEFQSKVKETFIGRVVQANYGRYAFYTIDDVTFDKNVNNTTIRRNTNNGNHENITLFNYYKDSYEKTVRDPRQPLFLTKKENPKTGLDETILLVPEFLLMTGLDEDMSKNENFKREMINKTKMDPKKRVNEILNFREMFYKNNLNNSYKDKTTGEMKKLQEPDEIRKDWGLELSRNPLEVSCRFLNDPSIEGGMGRFFEIQNGKIAYRNTPIANDIKFNKESWMLYYSDKNFEDAKKLVNSFKSCSKGIGILIDDPKFVSHRWKQEEECLEGLDNIKNLRAYQIIVIILNKNEKTFYKEIKNLLKSKYGIASQVVLKDNLSKNLSYFTNVLLQMNYKLSGELFVISSLHKNFRDKSMIVGLDCTRIPKSKEIRNFVMVSSYNESCSKYYTSVQKSSPDSVIAPACSLIVPALKKYQMARDKLPEYIFIYRSGSSEKEKEFIMKNEVEQIIQSLHTISSSIKLCFIIVNKKTEMKFFEGDRNPRAGTVIDQGCVNPFIYDFYLQPHYVNQGTATPTNFHVLCDQTNVPSEFLQELSYQLCYYYFNWNGPIRVPAPLKYAEVCNKFVTSNLTSLVENEKLKSTTYYI